MLKWRCDLINEHSDKDETTNTECIDKSGSSSFTATMASPAVPDVAEVSSATRRSSSPSNSSQSKDVSDGAESSTKRISSVSANEINFQWSEAEEPISSFTDDNNKLPCVARLERANFLLPGLRPYGEQPLLMFRRMRRRQARARTIYHDKGGAYYEVGQTILIPDDYTGDFFYLLYMYCTLHE
jgi:hypothetical protein